MMKTVNSLLPILILLISPNIFASTDNTKIATIFKIDQRIRTKENYKDWNVYTPIEARGFRMTILKELVNKRIITANDYYKSAIILVHSGAHGHENFILAAFLAQKASELGHKEGNAALQAAISMYSLSKQLPSNEWLLYEKNGNIFDSKNIKQ